MVALRPEGVRVRALVGVHPSSAPSRPGAGEGALEQSAYDDTGLLRDVEDEFEHAEPVVTLGGEYEAGSPMYLSEKTVIRRSSSQRQVDVESESDGSDSDESSSDDSDGDTSDDNEDEQHKKVKGRRSDGQRVETDDLVGIEQAASADRGISGGEADNDDDDDDDDDEEEEEEAIPEEIYCTSCGTLCPLEIEACSQCGTGLVDPSEFLGEDSDDEGDRSRLDSYDPFMNVKSLVNIQPPSPGGQRAIAAPAARPFPQTFAPLPPPPDEIYEVKFLPGKSGLTFDDDWLGKSAVVDELPRSEFLDGGPRAAGGSDGDRPWSNEIHVGDFLVNINGESCAGLCLERIEEMLKEAQKAGPYRIRFRTATSIQDAFGVGDEDASEARSIIYKQKSKIYEPPEHMDMVYGYILRWRSEKIISLHFFRESDNKFLLGAVLPRSGKGRIIFHNSQDIKLDGDIKDIPMHPESSRYLGCMEQNFAGTALTVHDYRVSNPTSTRKIRHHELGYIMYEHNVLGRVPNSLKAVLPRWDPEQGLRGQRRSLADRYKGTTRTRHAQDMNLIQKLQARKGDEYRAVESEELSELLEFDTLKPQWNEELQAWTLNFNSRVKMASKKNFMLVPQAQNETMEEEFGADTVCLRFGKVLKDRFSLDFRHPISPFQAMAIAVSAFTSKRLVT
ncbi:Tubby protein-like [Hondaea fermentalgiana]|uniref:Tubby protein-like n=1 Tax=Hondaea fermentalgiana TaxID=2315210 RepID=A0A2R5GUZ5_9STRA|nr:Tubby protein-like [Hondaea fermentalgiana]|eukprot:GBG31734.1 Tubby protein-like [Hondaea fermentalgiana]